ncbi:hypothetical protein ABPG72_000143 [Tetrahymena utriculariae]
MQSLVLNNVYKQMMMMMQLIFNEAASSFFNPLTVVGMLEVVKEAKVKAVVHSASASALGRMMVRYFKNNRIEAINIIRRQEQAEILKKEGASKILYQTNQDFLASLSKITSEFNDIFSLMLQPVLLQGKFFQECQIILLHMYMDFYLEVMFLYHQEIQFLKIKQLKDLECLTGLVEQIQNYKNLPCQSLKNQQKVSQEQIQPINTHLNREQALFRNTQAICLL